MSNFRFIRVSPFVIFLLELSFVCMNSKNTFEWEFNFVKNNRRQCRKIDHTFVSLIMILLITK
jgi:hypothetical protein